MKKKSKALGAWLAIAQLIIRPPRAGKKVVAFFNAFNGQYACNPKYILLKLHEKEPSFKAYFTVSKRHSPEDSLPPFAIPVRFGSIRHALLECRCNIRVTNSIFSAKFYCLSSLPAFLKRALKSRKLIISTWHGSGALKKIEADIIAGRRPAADVLSDFVIAGCRVNASILSTAENPAKPFPVSLTGTPRCDALVEGNADVLPLKERLGLPKDKKILLFAPTFRSRLEEEDDKEGTIAVRESGARQIEELDIPRLLAALHERFGDEWAFVFRAHHFVVEKMREQGIEAQGAIDGNRGDDMMEYLACADVLLTDYSSCMIDFALTGRPCFLFALDKEHYEKEERGFYSNFDALPFPFASSRDALIDNIRSFDEEAYKKAVKRHLEWLGCVEDGKASERLAECILRYIQTGEKRLETVDGVDTR